MDYLERKLQDPLDRVVEESEKKGLPRKYKKTEIKVKVRVTNSRYKHQAGVEVQISGKRFNRGQENVTPRSEHTLD